MYRILKWIGFVLGGLVGLAALALGVVYLITDAQLNKTYQISVKPLPIPSDPTAVARGKHLVTTVGLCGECHGDNLAGQNLTPGGELSTWTEADFMNTLRSGVNPLGRKLDPEMMPWCSLGKLSDDELKAIWLYLQSLPPVAAES